MLTSYRLRLSSLLLTTDNLVQCDDRTMIHERITALFYVHSPSALDDLYVYTHVDLISLDPMCECMVMILPGS